MQTHTHTHTLLWFQGQTPLSLLKHKWGDGRWRGSLAGPLCKGKIRKSSLSSKGSETKQGEKMTSPATNPAHLGWMPPLFSPSLNTSFLRTPGYLNARCVGPLSSNTQLRLVNRSQFYILWEWIWLASWGCKPPPVQGPPPRTHDGGGRPWKCQCTCLL